MVCYEIHCLLFVYPTLTSMNLEISILFTNRLVFDFLDLCQISLIMLFLGCTSLICLALLMIQIDLIQVCICIHRTSICTSRVYTIFKSFICFELNLLPVKQRIWFGGVVGVDILRIVGIDTGVGCL